MYKLCLIQNGDMWEWYLQSVIPADLPFLHTRARYFGSCRTVKEAMTQAHMNVNRASVSYIYLDRTAASRL